MRRMSEGRRMLLRIKGFSVAMLFMFLVFWINQYIGMIPSAIVMIGLYSTAVSYFAKCCREAGDENTAKTLEKMSGSW